METFWCPSTSFAASSPLICTEVDFDDVFGGPPRRFFAKEGRFNFHSDVGGLAEDRLRKRGNDERRRVSASMIRKKLSVDFFDDVFACNDFDGSRSASTHSSLLVELGKGMKVPASSSISHTPGTPSSRLLTYVRQSWKDTTTEEELCDGKTHLYVEFSLTSDGTVKILKNVIDEDEDIVNQKSAVRPRDNSVKKFLNNYNSNHDLDMKMKKAAESNQSDANKISVPSNTEEINGRKMVNEKVKELVAMFDKNRSFNSKLLAETLSQSSDGNDRSAMAVKKHKPETKPIVVENLKIDESGNGDSGNDPRTLVHNNTSVQHSDDSSPGSVPGSYRDENESFSDPLDEFEVKELRQEQGAESQTDEYQLAGTQESDAKIRKWSSGKQGNIRSLLSTMQHVLWPESGWKPVALVDIIETNQVKKIYQRALLHVHPDKLQQKGVSEQQRYIADKVFDILQVLSGAARMAFILFLMIARKLTRPLIFRS